MITIESDIGQVEDDMNLILRAAGEPQVLLPIIECMDKSQDPPV